MTRTRRPAPQQRHRYRLDPIPGLPDAPPPAQWSPQPLQLAPPTQGWLPLDGSALGPLFDTPDTTP